MKIITEKIYCHECSRELKIDEKACPICGSFNRNVKSTIKEELIVRGRLRIKHKHKGRGGFIREIIKGWFPSSDKRKHPKGVEKIRIIDREKDYYKEEIKDLKTDKITKTEEPLSRHQH